MNTLLNTFQPEIVIFLNTLSLSPKKVCVYIKKNVYVDRINNAEYKMVSIDVWEIFLQRRQKSILSENQMLDRILFHDFSTIFTHKTYQNCWFCVILFRNRLQGQLLTKIWQNSSKILDFFYFSTVCFLETELLL